MTKDYTATLTATITTTAPNAALSVHDPSSTATGHLVNGTLRDAAGAAGEGRTGASPRRRKRTDAAVDYTGPKSLDPVTIALQATVDATDGLHTGAYGKTLTFTLSTTTP